MSWSDDANQRELAQSSGSREREPDWKKPANTDKKCFDCQVNGRDCWHMQQASTDLDAQLSEDDIKNHLVYDILYDYEPSNSAIDELYAFITKLIADREREARTDELRMWHEDRGIEFDEIADDKYEERLAELRKEGDK